MHAHLYANIANIKNGVLLRHVALVRTDVSEEPSASFIRVTRIGELGTTLAATSNRHMLRTLGTTLAATTTDAHCEH
jgi:hypothetical protein